MPGRADDRATPRSTRAVEAVKLGAMDYLTKPLDFGRLEQLLAAVREEIERRREPCCCGSRKRPRQRSSSAG